MTIIYRYYLALLDATLCYWWSEARIRQKPLQYTQEAEKHKITENKVKPSCIIV